MKKSEKKVILAELAAKIEQDNEAFNNMTNAEKRVEVAKDLLIRIAIKQISPKVGDMLNMKLEVEETKQMKDVLNSETKLVCQACAKGGLFMAYIGRVNKETVRSTQTACFRSNEADSRGNSKLTKIFPIKQISAIEFAFEGKQYLKLDSNNKAIVFSEEERDKFLAFKKTYSSRKERLKAIAQNIIDNNGDFTL